MRDTKAQLLAAIVHATEAAGLMNQSAFLTAIGMPDDWIVRAANNPDDVSLNEFVQVYDAAADQAGWRSLADILKVVTLMQRYREWPPK